MDTQWIVLEIDGKIASVAADYRHLAEISRRMLRFPADRFSSLRTWKIPSAELPDLDASLCWDDLMLWGTAFQKKVWEQLYRLSHPQGDAAAEGLRLHSYSELAALCDNPLAVRPVAHVVAINPLAYIIPCHLIIPKESADRIERIRRGAEQTLFQGSDLYLLDSIDVGDFAYGSACKRELIKMQFSTLL